ncbi:hypothetical protein ABC347_06415 [Sphingomonas sp. 1P06PA]
MMRAIDEAAEAAVEFPAADEPGIEAPPAIGGDERRMHVRAYNYWVSLLDGRAFPSIADLDPASVDDFGPNSVLIDFSRDPENPEIPWLGRRLREEGDLPANVRTIHDVPRRSLVSRLTDHYLQILANRAPVGFEAEFQNVRGNNSMYRGILMPFSSDGGQIDFIYGVINWKEMADAATAADIIAAADRALRAPPTMNQAPIWADGPSREPLDADYVPPAIEGMDALAPGIPAADIAGDDADDLYDQLALARETADTVRAADGRSRAALYRALGLAYDFALIAEARPQDYVELLEDAGLKPQARAPMTPIVKLVFGLDYDKTRLTEFAAALAHGRRLGLPREGLAALLERQPGGLKGVVAAERAARRPDSVPDRDAAARACLRDAPALARISHASTGSEFVLYLGRRTGDGVDLVAMLPDDSPLVGRAVRQAVR